MWYLHSPRTTGKLQVNYRTIIIESHLKSSLTEVLRVRTYRSQSETGRRYRDAEGAWPTTMSGR